MAKLTFHGATRQVTGSCYLLETQGGRILLECGMFQGDTATTAQNRREFPFAPGSIDAAVISHAHIDHSGLLPRLVRAGFEGPVYVTAPTHDLLDLMLKDAAYLEMKDAQWENKWRQRAGKKPVEPLYTLDDVEALLALRRSVPYNDEIAILPGVRLRFHEAGHIVGSAVVEITLSEGNKTTTIVFSGDLGNRYSPLMRDPAVLDRARRLSILGGEIAVRAEIHTLGGFSAHAGQTQLVQWAHGFAGCNPRVYLVHGELEAMESLRTRLVHRQMRVEISAVGATIAI